MPLSRHRDNGKTRHGRSYYSCYPANNNADRLSLYPDGHPMAIYVREDALIDALDHVIATRVFGPDRHAFLRRSLAGLPDKRQQADAARADALRAQIEDLTARQDRLITELETTDPADRAFRDRLRRRFDTIEAERATLTAQLHDLTASTTTEPCQDEGLLDAVPLLERLNITTAPERIQRKLYDALQLQITCERPDQARFRIVLTDDLVEALATTTSSTATAPELTTVPMDIAPGRGRETNPGFPSSRP